ncbi:hypothetical protein D9M69_644170 [compost metagenome]
MDEAFIGADHGALVEGCTLLRSVVGRTGVSGQAWRRVDGVAHRFSNAGAVEVIAADVSEQKLPFRGRGNSTAIAATEHLAGDAVV